MAVDENIGNWQNILDSTLKEFTENGDLQRFEKLEKDEDKMLFIIKKNLIVTVPWIQAYFDHCQELNSKSEKKSLAARQEGNALFKKRQFNAAVEFYTKSLLLAPFESEQLSIGYSNRSAALFHLSRYKECLADIEQTFLCQSVPDHLHCKLSLRKGQCFYNLQQYQQSEDEFLCGKSFLENSNPTAETKNTQISEFDKWIKRLRTKQERNNLDTPVDLNTDVSDSDILPVVSYRPNETIIRASSAVKLCNDVDGRGRHLVAQHRINAGEVLIVEKPYAAILLPGSSFTHCQNCFQKVSSPFPCPFCCSVLFCSTKCREISWNSYHRVECRYLTLLHSVGIAHLSFRIILVTGLQKILDFKCEGLDPHPCNQIAGLTKAGQYDTNYLSVYSLMTHAHDVLGEDLLQYAMTAALLLHILDHSGWFESSESLPKNTSSTSFSSSTSCDFPPLTGSDLHLLSKSHLCIGAALFRHILQLVCNAHAITELQVSGQSPVASSNPVAIQTTSQVRVATAIYPTASLMNHSCEPTITSSFQKDTLIIRAVKDLECGEEIFTCYGPHSYRMSFEERHQILKGQYFFDCKCKACRNAVQDKALAPDGMCPNCVNFQPVDFLATSNKLQCPKCAYTKSLAERSLKISKAEQYFTEGLYQLDAGNIKVALDLFESCYCLRKEELPENDREIGEVLDCIARCLASLGQYREACKFLTRSVSITRHSYGGCSLELARELQKFCDMLYLDGNKGEALKYSLKAKEIFGIHFGSKCPEIKELEDFEKELNQREFKRK